MGVVAHYTVRGVVEEEVSEWVDFLEKRAMFRAEDLAGYSESLFEQVVRSGRSNFRLNIRRPSPRGDCSRERRGRGLAAFGKPGMFGSR